MNKILKILFSLSISGSIIAIILFALKYLFKDKLSKTWQYYIWIVVIIRLLIPYYLETNIVGELFYRTETYIMVKNEILEPSDYISIEDNSTIEVQQSTKIIEMQGGIGSYWNEIKNYLWFLWLGIAMMLLIRKITSYNSFIQYIKSGRYKVKDNHILELYCSVYKAEGIKKIPMLYTNPLVASPMLVGIIRPFIVLPTAEIKDFELRNIFSHELVHYKRLDIFYKWLVQITVCIHWFNPLVYFISKEINKNCELSCDEVIIKRLDSKGKREYGDTLLSSLKFARDYSDTIVPITLNEDAKLLKERLGAIMSFRKKSKIIVASSMILTAFICFGAMFTGAYASKNNPHKVNTMKSVESQSKQNNVGIDDVLNTSNKVDEGLNKVDKTGIELMEYSGSWEVVELLIPNMSRNGVDKITEIYNQKNQYSSKVKKKFSDYYNMSGDNVDSRALNMMQTNGMWKYTEPLFPYMSNDGIDKVVALYNQKHQGQEKVPSDYYNSTKEKVVIDLKNKYNYNIAESGSFEAKNNQTLALNITSTIKGGSVDLFLFDPNGKEQRITIGYESFVEDIKLTEGLWQYNCSGIFKDGGNITVVGYIKD